nr:transmembrane gamma-carboxyglutamic acid protein 4 [Dasypus novemcinctus]
MSSKFISADFQSIRQLTICLSQHSVKHYASALLEWVEYIQLEGTLPETSDQPAVPAAEPGPEVAAGPNPARRRERRAARTAAAPRPPGLGAAGRPAPGRRSARAGAAGGAQAAASSLCSGSARRPPRPRQELLRARHPAGLAASPRTPERFLGPSAGATRALLSQAPRVAEIVGVAPETAGLAAPGTPQRPSSGPGAPGACVPGCQGEAGRQGPGGVTRQRPPRRCSRRIESDSNAKRGGARGDRCPLRLRPSPGARPLSPGTLGRRLPGAGRDSAAETARGAQSRSGFRHNSLFDSCQAVFTVLVLLSQLPAVVFAFPHCTRTSRDSGHAGEEVFTSKEDANFFIHRRLLFNRFDMELFTPGDVERECYEELCNFEEAREIFGDEDKTVTFWQDYSIKGPATKSDGNREKIDVMSLLTGLIAAGVFLVIFGLLGYYLCITKCNRQGYPGSSAVYMRRGRHTPSIMFRRPEETVLSPSPSSVEDTGLPSYEQAVALTRKHSVSPPPPYPGPAKGFRVFKKSVSLPSH